MHIARYLTLYENINDHLLVVEYIVNVIRIFAYTIDVKSSLGYCPPSHPYAFASGDRCCKYNEDKGGASITLQSETCKDDAIKNCKDDPVKKDFCKNSGK